MNAMTVVTIAQSNQNPVSMTASTCARVARVIATIQCSTGGED